MRLHHQLKKIIVVSIAWTIVSLFNYLIGISAVVDANFIWDANYDLSKIDYWHGFYVSILTGISASLVGGGALVFFWEKWLRSKPYGWTIRNILISYIIIFAIVSVPTILFNNSYGKSYGLLSSEAWSEVLIAFTSPSLLAPFLIWLVVVLMTLVAFQVNDKYGPGVFKKFLLGRYFNPSREERIFMFLDLRSSTTIAEKLGEEQYFHFLKACFRIITPAIQNNLGEIYQYVGDEVVISWTKEQGLKNENCIKTFFNATDLIQTQSEYFFSKFGLVPEFKAGLHLGNVMAGEIGVIKREIAYSGDVLNTTARIQAKCNEHGVNILLSDQLLKLMDLSSFEVIDLGHIELRGKREPLKLFTLK